MLPNGSKLVIGAGVASALALAFASASALTWRSSSARSLPEERGACAAAAAETLLPQPAARTRAGPLAPVPVEPVGAELGVVAVMFAGAVVVAGAVVAAGAVV